MDSGELEEILFVAVLKLLQSFDIHLNLTDPSVSSPVTTELLVLLFVVENLLENLEREARLNSKSLEVVPLEFLIEQMVLLETHQEVVLVEDLVHPSHEQEGLHRVEHFLDFP